MVVHPSDKRKTIGSIPIGTTMKLYKILFVIVLLFVLFPSPTNTDTPDSETYYDGVYSGCILLNVFPNMTVIERDTIDQYCITRTIEAVEGGMMELFYEYKTEIQPEDIVEGEVEF